VNSKALEETIEVRLDRASGHLELRGNFSIVTALQQQLGDLLFPRAQPNRLFLHVDSFPRVNSNK
jgi:hypothetical protein